MNIRIGLLTSAAAIASLLVLGADSAAAKCTRLGFTVNDYGKEGPTRDAKALLDKYIAKWTAENGITRYTTGKKTVKCELFLDFGFFDEHTCRAEATVCWGGNPAAGKKGEAPSPAPSSATAPAATPARSDSAADSGKPEAPAAAPSPAKPASDAPLAPRPARVKPQAASL